jgi:hypothetical protein
MAGPSSTVTKGNILAGPGTMYMGYFGSVIEPAGADVNIAPAGSGGWADVGGTEGPMTITANQSFFVARVEQIPDPIFRRLTERDIQVTVRMAEGTLANIRASMNESQATSGGGSGFTSQELTPGQAAIFPTERAIIVDGYAPGTNKRRRAILRRVTSIDNVGMSWQKDGLFMVPVTFGALYVDATTSPIKWFDEA